MFHNNKMLNKIKEVIQVSWIGGRIEVNQMGTLPGFGKVYYHPDSITNILSFFDIAKTLKSSYNGIKNVFEVETITKTIQLKPNGKLYIWNAKEINDAVVLVDTVEISWLSEK